MKSEKNITIQMNHARFWVLPWQGNEAALSDNQIVKIDMEISGGLQWKIDKFLTAEIELINSCDNIRQVSVGCDLTKPEGWKYFFAGASPHIQPGKKEELHHGYCYFIPREQQLAMPLVTVYGDKSGWTCFLPLELPTRQFEAVARENNWSIIVHNVRLNPKSKTIVKINFVSHKGDWRPGLGIFRDLYPEYFFNPEDMWQKIWGGWCYNGMAGERQIKRWQREKLRVLEVHWSFPFQGKFAFPEEKSWIKCLDMKWLVARSRDPECPGISAGWQEILKSMNKKWPHILVKDIKEFLRICREHDILTMLYYDPTEAWLPFARDEFPECIVYNARMHGVYSEARDEMVFPWYNQVQVALIPGNRWFKHIKEEYIRQMDLFPEVAGTFMDEAAWHEIFLDFDDGVSICDGKPAARFEYLVACLAEELMLEAKKRGKLFYWNGPWMVDLMKYTVGGLLEGGGEAAGYGNLGSFLSIGDKPLCGHRPTVNQLVMSLVHGFIPVTPSMYSELPHRYKNKVADDWEPTGEALEYEKSYFRFLPLYEELRGRKWLLTEKPIVVPEPLLANAYILSNRNIAYTIVHPRCEKTGQLTFGELPIVLRPSNTDKIRQVRFICPELDGQRNINFKIIGSEIHLSLPRLYSAALLILSEVHISLAQLEWDVPDIVPELSIPTKTIIPAGLSKLVKDKNIHITSAIISGKLFALSGSDIVKSMEGPDLPQYIPRIVKFNGIKIGEINSLNVERWIRRGYLLPDNAIEKISMENNIIEIEPIDENDFLKVKDIDLTIILSNGEKLQGINSEIYSSCSNPMAEGVINTPVQIQISLDYEYNNKNNKRAIPRNHPSLPARSVTPSVAGGKVTESARLPLSRRQNI